jgi:hypothetical protein
MPCIKVITRMKMMMIIIIIYFSSVGKERDSKSYEGKHITGIFGKVYIFMLMAIAHSVWGVY